MPLATMASAMPLINCSLTLQPNLFQLFQPMGGVRASPLSVARLPGAAARKTGAVNKNAASARRAMVCMEASRKNRSIIHESVPGSAFRRGSLLLRRAVEDHPHLFEGDQPALDHFVEPRQDPLDALAGLDDLHHH